MRVYPDDISVDSFEHTLTETEAQDARTYWSSVWSAGGDEAGRRGAWKALLAGQGAGRSFWVTETYAPLNPADQPVPPAADPWIILSIPTREPLVEPELSAVRTYWTAVWRAADDLTALGDADDDLEAAVGAARAEELRQGYSPRNLAAGPPGTATRAQTTVLVAFLHFPTDEDARLRLHGWATTPQARLLPDRLVLLGFRGGQQVLEAIGEPVPATLAVAPDPSAAEEDQLRPDGAGLHVGPELEWVTDFERAVEQGMGFRIPLQSVDAASGLRRADRARHPAALRPGGEPGRPRGADRAPSPRQGRVLGAAPGPPDQQRRRRPVGVPLDRGLRHQLRPLLRDPAAGPDRLVRQERRPVAGRDARPRPRRALHGAVLRPHRHRRRQGDERRAVAGHARLLPGEHAAPDRRGRHDPAHPRLLRPTRLRARHDPRDPGREAALRHPAVGAAVAVAVVPAEARSRRGARRAVPAAALRPPADHGGRRVAAARPGVLRRQAGGRPPAGAARRDRPAPGVGGVPAAVRRDRDRALQPDAARRRRGGVPGRS